MTKILLTGYRGLAGQEILAGLTGSEWAHCRVELLGTGAGGEELDLPDGSRLPLRSADDDLSDVDLVFLATPPGPARQVGERSLRAGAAVVDLSGAFTQAPGLVPELNGHTLEEGVRLVRSPNCICVIMALALAGLERELGLAAVQITAFQSVSGAGKGALEQLRRECRGERAFRVLPGRIAGNLLPLVGRVEAGGASSEELDLVGELPILLDRPDLAVDATCVRVPVERGHCFAVTCRLDASAGIDQVEQALARGPGVEVEESATAPLDLVGSNRITVARVRPSSAIPGGYTFWVAADQLTRGTAVNALALGRLLLEKKS